MDREFCTTLKNLRQNKGVTQQQVADYLKVERTTYTSWEVGRNEPSLTQFRNLATYYKVDFNTLLGYKK